MSSTAIYDEIQIFKQKMIEAEDKIDRQKKKLNQEYTSEEEFMNKKNRYFARWDLEILRAKSVISFSKENRLAQRYLTESQHIVSEHSVEKHRAEVENTHKKIRSVIENDELILQIYKKNQNSLLDKILGLESQYISAIEYEEEQKAKINPYIYS